MITSISLVAFVVFVVVAALPLLLCSSLSTSHEHSFRLLARLQQLFSLSSVMVTNAQTRFKIPNVGYTHSYTHSTLCIFNLNISHKTSISVQKVCWRQCCMSSSGKKKKKKNHENAKRMCMGWEGGMRQNRNSNQMKLQIERKSTKWNVEVENL